jgi:hypothetical protein
MNRLELKKKLEDLGIPTYSYSLYGGTDINKTILEWGIKWRIHEIDERGGDHEIASFNTEEEACEYFYQMEYKWKKNEVMLKEKKQKVFPNSEKRTFIVSGDGNIEEEKPL